MNPEWATPTQAAQQDFASMKRLQSQLICSLLDLNERIVAEENKSVERRLKEEFARVQAITIPLSSLLKAEGVA